ncbi:MAG: dipeptidyl peptidase 3 [Prevotellaceae bacterium]|nr:dipeptidyl peptidase 3 [Prevotellaceae bacterium]
MKNNNEFNYHVDKFADVEVLRYQVPDFEQLTLQQKEYIYYLSQAATEGRDILFDQNGEYNLQIRKVLEAIYLNYKGDKNSEDYKQFVVYLKRVWFSNGIHHHYSMDKFTPEFSQKFFIDAYNTLPTGTLFPFARDNDNYLFDENLMYQKIFVPKLTKNELLELILPVIFDPTVAPKRVNQAEGQDLILTSANNYYNNVTQKEVEDFYNAKRNPNDHTPVSYGLNSTLIKDKNGNLAEEIWKIGGKYSEQIEKIVFWLEKAKTVAENEQQKKVISLLIDFYQTGDLKTFDDYSIAWVEDSLSRIDFVNGFIETYGDPLGIKASWESIVNFKNLEATKRTETISQNAQWFEDNSPVDKRFKKETVRGVSAKVITAAMLGGDCYPATPIGINLPNSNWIRAEHGSKSVTIENITDAYDKAARGNGFLQEFAWSDAEIALMEKYGFDTDNLHTDLHECLGHGSGKLLPGVSPDALKAYGATIEEARADLFGLYYMADRKMLELDILNNADAYKSEYYKFMMNGLLTQLVRINLGDNIQESHMRNRQLIAKWVFEKGAADKVVELKKRGDKTFVVINDYEKLRQLFGQLLAEIQRVKSEGDFEAAKNLVENYGIKINPEIHKEIKSRYEKLNIAPYKGFVNPVYTPVFDEKGKIIDVKIDYTEGYTEQMLRYSGKK